MCRSLLLVKVGSKHLALQGNLSRKRQSPTVTNSLTGLAFVINATIGFGTGKGKLVRYLISLSPPSPTPDKQIGRGKAREVITATSKPGCGDTKTNCERSPRTSPRTARPSASGFGPAQPHSFAAFLLLFSDLVTTLGLKSAATTSTSAKHTHWQYRRF